MTALVTYQLRDGIATITMDDGKVNALSVAMLAEINAALDRATADRAVVILTGRDNVFSAGFDLRTLAAGSAETATMVRTGFELGERLFLHPRPVVIACTGHAIAMGSFLVLGGDYRIGVAGPHKIGANEVAIGVTMPHFGLEICRYRLSPSHLQRALLHAELFPPDQAVVAGFLDRVVAAPELQDTAWRIAGELAKLNAAAHAATKQRVRAAAAVAIRAAVAADGSALQVQSR